MCAQRGNAHLQSPTGERDADHTVFSKCSLFSEPHHQLPGRKAKKPHVPVCSPPQVVFPEKHWLPQEKLSQLEVLLPPRQKVRITEDMDQVELKEFNPNEQNWRQHREAYEEDDDGPRAGVQCQTA